MRLKVIRSLCIYILWIFSINIIIGQTYLRQLYTGMVNIHFNRHTSHIHIEIKFIFNTMFTIIFIFLVIWRFLWSIFLFIIIISIAFLLFFVSTFAIMIWITVLSSMLFFRMFLMRSGSRTMTSFVMSIPWFWSGSWWRIFGVSPIFFSFIMFLHNLLIINMIRKYIDNHNTEYTYDEK